MSTWRFKIQKISQPPWLFRSLGRQHWLLWNAGLKGSLIVVFFWCARILLAAPAYFDKQSSRGLAPEIPRGERCRGQGECKRQTAVLCPCATLFSHPQPGGWTAQVGLRRCKSRPHPDLAGVIPNEAYSPAQNWEAGAQKTSFLICLNFKDIRLRARKGSNKDRPSLEVSCCEAALRDKKGTPFWYVNNKIILYNEI